MTAVLRTDRFEHEAMLYRGDDDFLAGLLPFVLDGLEEPAFGPDDRGRGGRPLSWANYTDIPPVLVARVRPAG